MIQTRSPAQRTCSPISSDLSTASRLLSPLA